MKNILSKYAILILLISSSINAESTSLYKIGDRGYLMEACEAASSVAKPDAFKSGYCLGVYHAASDANLLKMGTLGNDYCPTEAGIKTNVGIAIVAKWIRNHPKQWYTGQDYYAVVLAMKEAYPCK